MRFPTKGNAPCGKRPEERPEAGAHDSVCAMAMLIANDAAQMIRQPNQKEQEEKPLRLAGDTDGLFEKVDRRTAAPLKPGERGRPKNCWG